jgi:hypothetical protein
MFLSASAICEDFFIAAKAKNRRHTLVFQDFETKLRRKKERIAAGCSRPSQ